MPVATAIVALFPSLALTCTTPVFRYALERWEPDVYEILVEPRGPLDEADEAAIGALRKAAEGPPAPNVSISIADPAAEEGDGPAAGARLAVRYPRSIGIQEPAWEGPARGLEPAGLFDSPARREIARRILSGDSAVWMLLESGERETDEEIAKRIAAVLEGIPGKIEIPEPLPGAWLDPFGGPIGGPPLKVAFSLLRVSRSDPAEAMFVRLLLQSDPSLRDEKGPIAFPIFGRGRALCALRRDELVASTIEDVCSFLVGGCSCEVKAQNPGIDLLMAADWNGAFAAEILREIELPSPAAPPSEAGAEAAVEIPSAPDPRPGAPAGSSPGLLRNILIAIGACVVLVAAANLALRRRRGS